MKTTTRTVARIAAVALALVVGVVAALYWKSAPDAHALPHTQAWDAFAWRAQLFAHKARGNVPDLSWSELWQMTRVRGGFGLGGVVTGGLSLEGSVSNPHVTDDDIRVGARIFGERCASCHGGDGSGLHGPPLSGSGYRRGDSDLALYKVLRDGIADTTMLPPGLDLTSRWQVIGYLRSLQLKRVAHRSEQAARAPIQVTVERLRSAGARLDEWLTYSGSLDGRRYTPLAQIAPANVAQLRVRWIRQFATSENKLQATPLVIDGMMFVTEPPAGVVALDVRSGEILWTHSRPLAEGLSLCCGRVNRGLAIFGRMLYFGSLDGYLVALDASNGHVVWQAKVADAREGYSLTGAPLVADESVVVGVAGGEFGVRGFLAAYDTATGRLRWKFNTIPGPGEAGHETWKNDAWRTGGGPTWTAGSFDPALGLVYWGVGNPAPVFARDARPGDNLYTNSVVALDIGSGRLVWHFQFTPNDDHDWDSTQTPILADIVVAGARRKVICWANRNGFYYVLDRATGEFLLGAPFVGQNWARGLDAKGRPVLRAEEDAPGRGRLTRPGVAGATNWQNPAYDEDRGLVFVPAVEGASVFTASDTPRRGERGTYMGSAGSLLYPIQTVVRALDVATGARRWERYGPTIKSAPITYSGLLATGGGLIFGASSGELFALDSNTGQELWSVQLGGETLAAPISFTVDGRQVIAVSAGRSLLVFGL